LFWERGLSRITWSDQCALSLKQNTMQTNVSFYYITYSFSTPYNYLPVISILTCIPLIFIKKDSVLEGEPAFDMLHFLTIRRQIKIFRMCVSLTFTNIR
jgi:hypothetical protein